MEKRAKPWRVGERGEWVAGEGEGGQGGSGRRAHIVFSGVVAENAQKGDDKLRMSSGDGRLDATATAVFPEMRWVERETKKRARLRDARDASSDQYHHPPSPHPPTTTQTAEAPLAVRHVLFHSLSHSVV